MVVDADLVAREVVTPGSAGLAEVVETFGPEVLTGDGSLDRAALGARVFGDAAARARLEAITHPRIRSLTEERFRAAPQDAVVLHDVPLLVELGYEDRYHLTVVVHADVEERVRRLVEERGSSEEDARRRVAAQADDDARRRAADVWLTNTGGQDALLEQVDRLWHERLVPFEAAVRLRTPVPPPSGLVLAAPEPGWAATGARLAARVARAVGDAGVRVDHVGPTAVPGLPAEDVLDLQLVVADLAVADAMEDQLAQAGFPRQGSRRSVLAPGGTAGWAEHRHGSADPGQAVTLHVRAAGSPVDRHTLLLRDWLRAEPAERDGYAAVRERLAVTLVSRDELVEAEQPWLSQVAWPRMQAWADRTGWRPPEGPDDPAAGPAGGPSQT